MQGTAVVGAGVDRSGQVIAENTGVDTRFCEGDIFCFTRHGVGDSDMQRVDCHSISVGIVVHYLDAKGGTLVEGASYVVVAAVHDEHLAINSAIDIDDCLVAAQPGNARVASCWITLHLGIIGDGVLGQSVATIGRALGMRVLFSAHKGRTGQGSMYTPFEEVLRQSDILTLHCPLNANTRHMIGAAEFAQMARKPLLINTGRGGLVDEAAVGPALQAGHIAGAAFDVTSVEPPPADHPFMALLDRPDFILTPHVAWASAEAIQALADQLIDNVEAFVRGAPVNQVLPKN